MHQCRGLALDRFNQTFVRVTKDVDSNAAREIEISTAILTNKMAMFTTHWTKAATGVNRHQRRDRHHYFLRIPNV